MEMQEIIADFSVPITLKEAIRECASGAWGGGRRRQPPPTCSLGKMISPQFWLLNETICPQRKLPSFAPRREIYVVHREFGRVVNIGMEGFCFIYLDNIPHKDELPGEGLLFTAADLSLDGLPLEVMADLVVIPLVAGHYQVRKRCVKFGALNDRQIENLEQFILTNAYIPQLAAKTKKRRYPALRIVAQPLATGRRMEGRL